MKKIPIAGVVNILLLFGIAQSVSALSYSASGWIKDSAFNNGAAMDISGTATLDIFYSVEDVHGNHFYGDPIEIYNYITNNDNGLFLWQHINFQTWHFPVNGGEFLFETSDSTHGSFVSEARLGELEFFNYNVGGLSGGSGNWTNWPSDVADIPSMKYDFYDNTAQRMDVMSSIRHDPAYILFDWQNYDGSFSHVLHLRLDKDAVPVPEPATMLLFGAGLAGLLGVSRKYKK